MVNYIYEIWTKEKGYLKVDTKKDIYNYTLHRDDGPAYIKYNPKGIIVNKRWYTNGKIHNDKAPAEFIYDEKTGELLVSIYYKYGKFHNDNGPAQIYYNGKLIDFEVWCQNGLKHRDNGPAETYYYSNGNVRKEYWYSKDILHNDNGPTVVKYYEDKTIREEQWYQKGKLHRENGPAIAKYNPDNKNLKEIYFYIHNIPMNLKHWLEKNKNKITIKKISDTEFIKLFNKYRNTSHFTFYYKYKEYLIIANNTNKTAVLYYIDDYIFETKIFESFNEFLNNK